MKRMNERYRFLFAGGGTGGHLFPAIAIAEAIRELKPESDILFVGNPEKIEGSIVPKMHFQFKKISVRGFNRKMTLKNLMFPVYLIISVIQSLLISMKFKPIVAIGTGGYVAGPSMWAAHVMGSKIILIEPNSYPGITTRLLEKYADEIHISFEYTKKFLRRQEIIKLTGNPIRNSLKLTDKFKALEKFYLSQTRKTILVLGGSLGASSINNALMRSLDKLLNNNIQIIWQVGKNYYDDYKHLENNFCKIFPFIENVNEAFSASDLVVARAGASTISELALLGLPAILIPSPNVAENHQYHNAKALAEENAVILIEDKNVGENLSEEIIKVIFNQDLLNQLGNNIKKFAKPEASYQIARRAINFAETYWL
jgi:UDP-N-acetylglucosamine--N-acetylmuramyl-(pentapeptide) pyrophosphoryl-undecaprenol N-acetylglucosamine transferase